MCARIVRAHPKPDRMATFRQYCQDKKEKRPEIVGRLYLQVV